MSKQLSNFLPTTLGTKEYTKLKTDKRYNIIKTRMEINNTENGKTTEKIINEIK